MKFKIVNYEGMPVYEEQEVKARLSVDCDGILSLKVGEWYVFDINKRGLGCLIGGVGKNNKEGLQVDEDGCVILEGEEDE